MHRGENAVDFGIDLIGDLVSYTHVDALTKNPETDVYEPTTTTENVRLQRTDLSKDEVEMLGARYDEKKTIALTAPFDFTVTSSDYFVLDGINYKVIQSATKLNRFRIYANSY